MKRIIRAAALVAAMGVCGCACFGDRLVIEEAKRSFDIMAVHLKEDLSEPQRVSMRRLAEHNSKALGRVLEGRQ